MPTPPDQKPSQSGIDKTIPKADQGPYNYTLSQAATTLYGSSMAKPSEYDTESRLTTYTYTSQADAQKFLKKVDNRVRHICFGVCLYDSIDRWLLIVIQCPQ